jgi:hypothetical protein
MIKLELCWAEGPKHDWVPNGEAWICDRCGEEEDD